LKALHLALVGDVLDLQGCKLAPLVELRPFREVVTGPRNSSSDSTESSPYTGAFASVANLVAYDGTSTSTPSSSKDGTDGGLVRPRLGIRTSSRYG
jgi:hypothetical protein